MRLFRHTSLPFCVLLLVVAESCAIFSSGGSGARALQVEQRSNGVLFHLPDIEQNTAVTAFVSRRHWVIVTIVDPEYRELKLSSGAPSPADSLEFHRFDTGVELAVHFGRPLRSVEVIRDASTEEVVIAAFAEDQR